MTKGSSPPVIESSRSPQPRQRLRPRSPCRPVPSIHMEHQLQGAHPLLYHHPTFQQWLQPDNLPRRNILSWNEGAEPCSPLCYVTVEAEDGVSLFGAILTRSSVRRTSENPYGGAELAAPPQPFSLHDSGLYREQAILKVRTNLGAISYQILWVFPRTRQMGGCLPLELYWEVMVATSTERLLFITDPAGEILLQSVRALPTVPPGVANLYTPLPPSCGDEEEGGEEVVFVPLPMTGPGDGGGGGGGGVIGDARGGRWGFPNDPGNTMAVTGDDPAFCPALLMDDALLYAKDVVDGSSRSEQVWQILLTMTHGDYTEGLGRYCWVPSTAAVNASIPSWAVRDYYDRTGVCDELAMVLVSFLRAREIPARMVVLRYYPPLTAAVQSEASHAIVEYQDEDGLWYHADPSFTLFEQPEYYRISMEWRNIRWTTWGEPNDDRYIGTGTTDASWLLTPWYDFTVYPSINGEVRDGYSRDPS